MNKRDHRIIKIAQDWLDEYERINSDYSENLIPPELEDELSGRAYWGFKDVIGIIKGNNNKSNK